MPQYLSGPCPACGEARAVALGTPDLSKDPVGAPVESRVLQCGRCGHLRIDPMPSWSEADFQLLYGDGYFVPDSPRWGRIRESVNPSARYSRIQSIIKTEKRDLLEVGSGIYAHFCTKLAQEGWKVLAQEPSPYAERLKHGVARTMPERLVDELLVAAVIEARSHERMQLLSEAFAAGDPELAAFYADLVAAEARHAPLYVDLAAAVLPAAVVAARHQAMLAHEAAVLAALPFAPRLHSGWPVAHGG